MTVATTLIVFGRGVRPDGDGYRLTPSSVARTEAACDYAFAHRDEFAARDGRVIFSGGWPEASEGSVAPPDACREGALMLGLARAAGLDAVASLHAECESRSTLENLLCTLQAGLLDGMSFDADRPLGVVSHPGHTPRIRFLVRKVFGLRGPSVVEIRAHGVDVPTGKLSDRVLDVAARVTLAGARSHAALLRRERRVVAAARRLERFLP